MSGYVLVVPVQAWLSVHDRMLRCSWIAEYLRDEVVVRFQTRHAMKKCERLLAEEEKQA